MLQVKNLTITHRKDLREIIKEFSFVLNRGDKAVMIGEEGNGKSTLLKWMYDLELFISHDETLIERTANVVNHMEQIRRKTQCRHTVVRLPYRDYMKQRTALFESQER